MSQYPKQNIREDIEYLFRYILATLKASHTDGKVSLVCNLQGDTEEWYVLVGGTFRMDSLDDFEHYQRTHGAITPLH